MLRIVLITGFSGLATAATCPADPVPLVEPQPAGAARISERHPSDNSFGQETLEILTSLLPDSPDMARTFFLDARTWVAAERAAQGASQPGSGGDRGRSVSALGAALAGALQRVETRLPQGDPRLPGVIAATAGMLAADVGCGVEGNVSVRFHAGVMMQKAATDADGTFRVQALTGKLGPLVKEADLPVLFGAARHLAWGLLRNDEAADTWLAEQAATGPHKALARMLLAAARISRAEKDAGNRPRAGITDRAALPEEQRWLLEMIEQKSVPPAALATCGAEILRQWPTAEPPLRYACAHALAAAWAADVPMNLVEAGCILTSMEELLAGGKAPADEGFGPAVDALAAAWRKRLERNRTPLYGWPAAEIRDDSLAGQLFLLCRARSAEEAERLLSDTLAEAARDPSLTCTVRLSEAFHVHRLYPEAARILAAISPAQQADPAVDETRRTHISIKRYHLPLDAAGTAGTGAAVKATIALLKANKDDPAAWTGAAWSWWVQARDSQDAGDDDGTVLRWCMSTVLARAADHLSPDVYGKFQPDSEARCREWLKAKGHPPERLRMLRSPQGVQLLLDAFGGAWQDMPPDVKERLMPGTRNG